MFSRPKCHPKGHLLLLQSAPATEKVKKSTYEKTLTYFGTCFGAPSGLLFDTI